MTVYSNLLQRLFSLHRQSAGRMHLEVMQLLCEKLGNPQQQFKSIHVAGTNGKGSTCRHLAQGLLASKYKSVGLYTSPHISTFRERIQINNQLIPEPKVCELLTLLFQLVDSLKLKVSFFELTTALAFLYFAEQKVDIAVIEVGLGGRFDATNVIQPRLSVITSISLEHTDLLGTTIASIALEKAGIIKPNTPVVVGPTVPDGIIYPIAANLQAPYHKVNEQFEDFRLENRAIATKALSNLGIDCSRLDNELHQLPTCRFEQYFSTNSSVPIIFDVAHNPGGMQKLAYLLNSHFPKQSFCIVIALSKNKDLDDSLAPLIALGKQNYWFPVEAVNQRSYPCSALIQSLIKQGISSSQIFLTSSIQQAIYQTQAYALPVIICGSFFIMQAARRAAGILEPCDKFDLNEHILPIR